MPGEPIRLLPDEEVLVRFRPAWRSFWVFFLGLILCWVGPWMRENPPLSPQTGLLFGAIFALLILRRWSESYTLTNRRLLVRGGLFGRETAAINLADIADVEAYQGISLRLVKAGHVLIRSSRRHEGAVMIYGQPDPYGLKKTLEKMAVENRIKTGGTLSTPAPESGE
ncbi:MAG: PH domain-containing protein [Thermodesulfobacteriota bacterium]